MFLVRCKQFTRITQLFRNLGTPVLNLRQYASAFPVDDGAGQWPVGVGKGKFAPGYSGSHDVGGVEKLINSSIDLAEKPFQLWERQTHAILVLLVGMKIMTVDELRRAVEQLHPLHYSSWSYYEKWAAAMSQILLENKLVSNADLNGRDCGVPISGEPSFKVGDFVRVKEENIMSRSKKPHLRTPGYIFGANGEVERYCGQFHDPSFLAFQKLGKEEDNTINEKQHLYRVRFQQRDLWDGYDSSDEDTVDVEIYESWLEAISRKETKTIDVGRNIFNTDQFNLRHAHSDDEPNHVHLNRLDTEQNAVSLEGMESPGERLANSLCNALLMNDILTRPQINKAIERVDMLGRNYEGNKIVARAWVDETFKRRLLGNATEACAELGITASNTTTSTVLTVVENEEQVHNLVVCTLCSCYPLTILGLAPPWYKSREYRAQAVRKPREMLKNTFGLEIPQNVTLRVHDSTADLRYLVLPMRPKGTENWSEKDLQKIVTRDCLIGVAVPELK